MKKVLSIIVALTMVFTFSLPAFAFTQECWDTIGSAVSSLTGGEGEAADGEEGSSLTDTLSGIIEMLKGLLGNIDLSAITDTIGGLIGGGDADTDDTTEDTADSSSFMDTISGLIETVKGMLENLDLSAVTDAISGLLGGGEDAGEGESTGLDLSFITEALGNIDLSGIISTITGLLGGAEA